MMTLNTLGFEAPEMGMCVRSRWLIGVLLVMMSAQALAELTIEPITWDIVGLDHNRPLTEGPELFPVGARVCSDVAVSNADVELIWEEPNAFINARPGSLTILQTGPLAAGGCFDAYFELQLTRDAAAFGESRRYRIEATDDDSGLVYSSPTPRAIFIEQLVSQNRNTTTMIRWGQQADESDWQTLGAGGGLNLAIGETYFIELTTETATAYEQLESFLTLSNTIFQIKSVETTYGVKTAPDSRVPVPNPSLYADGCLWEPDLNSPNYNSCLSDGKAGGIVTTVYEIDIISGGGDSVGLEALIYDKSGSSFHYNTDFSQSPGELVTYDPAASGFAKRFFPDTISVGATSRLVFTITNPNPVELGGYNFIDNLPAGVEVAATPNASTTCGGIWNPSAGDTSLAFDIDTDVIGPNSTCSILVDVTAPEGTYSNVSNNLFIGDFDTGLQASDELVVADQPPPPACVPGMTHSSWTMEPGAGTAVPPDPTTVYSSDLADAVASYTAATGGSQYIETADGQPANAWGGIGWSVATEPDNSVGPGPTDPSWFEFQLDTAEFSTDPTEPMSISLDMFPTPNGDWASNTNITMNVHVSTDGGATWTAILNDNTVGKTNWNTRSVDFTPGLGATNVRVNVTGVKSGSEASAAVLLDNVIFAGCGPGTSGTIPDPPELTKAFSPATIGAGEISTLTFTVTNPNATSPDDDLSGIDFTDNLPAGVVVAPVPNAATTCGGTVTADAGASLISLADGEQAAGGSCQVSVDVTSSAVATHVNISDFIFADESGQNNTSNGFATDTLTVLAPPVIEKTFDPLLVLLGVTPGNLSALVFTVTNPNPFNGINGVALTDNLPPGLTIAATPNVVSSGCGTPTITAAGGGSTISFSGGDIAAGDVCVVSVDVEGPIGVFDNVTSNVSHVVGGVTVDGNNATAQLVIDNPIPSVAMQKQVGPTTDPNGVWSDYRAVEVGDSVYYKLTVENIGETELTGISVSDPNVDTSSCSWTDPLPVVDSGNPEAHIDVCIVGPVTISSSGEFPNTAQVDASGDGTPVQDTDDALVATAALTIDKQADRSVFEAAGELINYSFTVTNSGAATLSAPVAITDPLVTDALCPGVSTVGDNDNFFDPGESLSCSGTYTTTPGDVSNGQVVNTAFASTVETDSPTDSVTVELSQPALTVAKALTGNADEDGSTSVTLGDTLSYTITASNTGNTTLDNVVVSDTIISPNSTTCTTLASGADCVLTGTYTVTQADVDAGEVVNTGTGDSDETPPSDDTLTTSVSQSVGMSLTKVIDSGSPYSAVGDTISYTITAENTGNVTLSAVSISDPDATVGSCTPAQPTSLAPGATLACSATYSVVQADLDNGTFTNQATVQGSDPDSNPVGDSDTATATASGTPALSVNKTFDGASPDPIVVGSELTYTVTASNTGTVSLNSVVVSDSLISPNSTTCATLAPGADCVLTGTYTVAQADVDAGEVVNTGTGDSDESPPSDDTETTPIPQSADVRLTKVIDSGSPYSAVGDTISYTITAENTGNVTLSGVSISDPDAAIGSCTPAQPTSLAPGAMLACSASYSVVQADLDSGMFTNQATVAGTDPDSNPVGDSDTATATASGTPALSVSKAFDGASPSPIEAGSVLTYTVTASNTGNVTLNSVVVSDSLISPNSTTCATLAPDADCVLTGTYTVTQADVESGEIVNTGTGDSDETPPSEDTVTIPVPRSVGLNLSKVIDSGSPYSAVGDTISYTITAENTGNVTLSAVSISDPDATIGSCTPAQPTSLAPGATLACSATYSVVQADLDNGTFTNEATVQGTDPDSDPVSDSDTATATVIDDPGLSLSKTFGGASPSPIVVGSELTYTLTASNTGNVTLNSVVVSDSLISPNSTTCATLAPGADCVLTGTYTVTQADVESGEVVNTGTADSDETPQSEDTVTIPVPQAVGLSLTKVVDSGSPYSDAGDTISYTITAGNPGNVTLSAVSISDPDATIGGCTPAQPTDLAPNATLVCSASYSITQADLDNGTFVNEATVQGTDPDGDPVSDSDTATATGVNAPALSVSKTFGGASPSPIVVGSELSYTVTASNTGNVELTNVVVSDSLITPDSNTCATLAPGADCVLTGTYTVTQADVDAGEVVNTGTGDSDETPPVVDTVTTPIGQSPAMEMVKTLEDAPDPVAVGSVLTYSVTATNTGNVTLNNVVIDDAMIDPGQATCATLPPGDQCVLTGTYTVTQADADVGEVSNTGTAESDETPPGDDTVVTSVGLDCTGADAGQPGCPQVIPVPSLSAAGRAMMIVLLVLFAAGFGFRSRPH